MSGYPDLVSACPRATSAQKREPTMMHADELTVVVADTTTDRTLTFTDVHYQPSWNNLRIIGSDGAEQNLDRIYVVDIQALKRAAPAA